MPPSFSTRHNYAQGTNLANWRQTHETKKKEESLDLFILRAKNILNVAWGVAFAEVEEKKKKK